MNPTRPFDLDRLNFDKHRLAKRRKLLLVSLIPCLVIGVVALKLISLSALATIAHSSYQSGDYDRTANTLSPLRTGNWFEPYLVHFDQANARYKQGDYQQAEESYRRALETVPEERECDVRINLALSIIGQADALLAQKSYDQAIVRYDDAKAVVYDGQHSCGVQFNDQSSSADQPKDGSDGAGDEDGDSRAKNAADARSLEKDIQSKSDTAKRMRNGDKTDVSDQSQTQADTSSTQSKIDRLERQAADAQQKRAQAQQTSRDLQNYDKQQPKYDEKNW